MMTMKVMQVHHKEKIYGAIVGSVRPVQRSGNRIRTSRRYIGKGDWQGRIRTLGFRQSALNRR